MFWGIAGLAALAPAGYVISGIAASLTTIAAVASSPIVIAVAGATALYEAYEHWDKLKQLASDAIKFTVDVAWPHLPDWLQHLFTGLKPTGHATGRGYNAGVKGTDWYDPEPVPYVQRPSRGRGYAGTMLPPLSLLDLKQQTLSVSGQAVVDVRNQLTVKVEGPGEVTNQTANGARATVPLNTGKGMSDTDKSGGRSE
jgi:hypothetical protein